jgi:hypothetical protein
MASIPPQACVWTRLGLASLLTRDTCLLCLTPDKDGAEEASTTRMRQREQVEAAPQPEAALLTVRDITVLYTQHRGRVRKVFADNQDDAHETPETSHKSGVFAGPIHPVNTPPVPPSSRLEPPKAYP